MPSPSLETIYVALLNEAPGTLRPVQAARRAGGVFEILSRNDDPDSEQWEFTAGSLVRCVERRFGQQVQLVAMERVLPFSLRAVQTSRP